jgi:hypothetical protein
MGLAVCLWAMNQPNEYLERNPGPSLDFPLATPSARDDKDGPMQLAKCFGSMHLLTSASIIKTMYILGRRIWQNYMEIDKRHRPGESMLA